MRIAYVISAYTNLEQVARLIRLLGGTDAIAVHVDRKTDRREFERLREDVNDVPSVTFLDRHPCHYGGFGHVRATLKGIEDVLGRAGDFSHLVLLTGQDYPIKPLEMIRSFLDRHRDQSFMGHNPLPSPHWSPRGGLDRVEYRHLHWRGRRIRLPGRRQFPNGLRPFGGGAYWCLSLQSVRLIARFVVERPDVVRFFERVDVPDETFFQTIVLNSDLASTVVNDNLRHIEWSRGPRPAILGLHDFPALRDSSKLFARKFDTRIDHRVLDAIDRELLRIRS
jgi:hypothetical protein